MALLLLAQTFVLFSTVAAPHVVTSLFRLAQLADFEFSLLRLIHQLPLPIELRNFATGVEAEYEGMKESGRRYLDLPIHQYRLIRRFSVDWPALLSQLHPEKHFLKQYQLLSEKHNEIDRFSSNDLPIAAYGLSFIQTLYGDHAALVPKNLSTNRPMLTALEMLELAAITYISDVEKDTKVSQFLAQFWLKLFSDRLASALPYASIENKINFVLKRCNKHRLGILSRQGGYASLQVIRMIYCFLCFAYTLVYTYSRMTHK